MNQTSESKIIKNHLLRNLVFLVGCLSLVMGLAGVFLPLLPTTPFLMLSAFCFVRSSERAHTWLQNHPLLWPPLNDWVNKKAISVKTKITATILIGVSLMIIWLRVDAEGVRITVTALLVAVTAYILTRKSV